MQRAESREKGLWSIEEQRRTFLNRLYVLDINMFGVWRKKKKKRMDKNIRTIFLDYGCHERENLGNRRSNDNQ